MAIGVPVRMTVALAIGMAASRRLGLAQQIRSPRRLLSDVLVPGDRYGQPLGLPVGGLCPAGIQAFHPGCHRARHQDAQEAAAGPGGPFGRGRGRGFLTRRDNPWPWPAAVPGSP